MKDVPHHAQDATLLDLGNGHPVACPDHHIVSQRAEQHQYVLRLTALIVAFGQSQSLLITFQRGSMPPPLIIKGHVGKPDRDGISRLRTGAPEHCEDLLSRQRADQHAVSEGAVLSATAHGKASHRTHIAQSVLGDPAKSASGPDGVLDPLGDGPGQAEHPLPRILSGYEVIAPSQQPIEIVQGPGVHAENRARPVRRISCKVVSAACTEGSMP
jgi:hypothetical protein